MFPPASPDPGQLLAIREALRRLDFTESGVCRRARCATVYDFQTRRAGRSEGVALEDPLDALIRLFMDGEPVPRGAVVQLLPPGLCAALEGLELLAPVSFEAGPGEEALAARALLYPTEGLYIVSDLERDPDFPRGRPDSVYPAITKSCEIYVSMLPPDEVPTFLEICSGTGIAALRAAKAGGRAWAVDIAERSTAFARFNAALNGLANVTALQGDLFEPVAGLQFDRIAAHPPYVPSLEQRQIYRDGGEDGEQITRRLLAGVRDYLRPGGRLYCTCVATDRREAQLEQRIRSMLGERASDCDVLMLVSHAEEPLDYLAKQVAKKVLDFSEAERFRSAFDALEIERFVGGTIVIERHATSRPPLTLRRHRGPNVTPVDVDAVLRWEAFPRDRASLALLAGVRPRLAARARMDVTHVPRDGGWAPQRARITVEGPLPFAMEASPEAATFLARCDGAHTVREHQAWLVADGAVGADAPLEEFADLVRSLLAAGLLDAEPPSQPAPTS